MRIYILLTTLFLLASPASIYPRVTSLTDSALISVIIEAPSNKNIVYMNGHIALRINDTGIDVDYVFSYGAFVSLAQVYLAPLGKQVSELYGTPTETAIQEAIEKKGVRITEHILNFTNEEKERLWQDLMFNALPENREYEYDIFRKNCATLPLELIERNVTGKINYNFPSGHKRLSYREIAESIHETAPWVSFIRDIAANGKTDKKISKKDEFFVPSKIEAAFLSANIVDKEGISRPLISFSYVIDEGQEHPPTKTYITPLQFAILLLIFTIILTIIEFWRRKYYRIFDCILFGVTGLAGLLFSILLIYSTYDFFSPNWLILWLHPFHLLGTIFFSSKRLNKSAYYYHILNILLMTFIISGKFFLPRCYNDAFLPFMFCLWIRSLARIVRYYNNIYFDKYNKTHHIRSNHLSKSNS